MRHSYLLIGLLILAPSAGVTADQYEGLKSELIEMEKQSWVAWKSHDVAFFDRFLSADHVEMGFGGAANKKDVLASVGSPSCTVKSYVTKGFHVTLFNSDTAVVTYYADQDTICDSAQVPHPVWVSSLYVRRDGRWLNAWYQQSQVQP